MVLPAAERSGVQNNRTAELRAFALRSVNASLAAVADQLALNSAMNDGQHQAANVPRGAHERCDLLRQSGFQAISRGPSCCHRQMPHARPFLSGAGHCAGPLAACSQAVQKTQGRIKAGITPLRSYPDFGALAW